MIRQVIIAASTGALSLLALLIIDHLRSQRHRGHLWPAKRGAAAQAWSRAWAAAASTVSDFGWLIAINLAAVLLGAAFWMLVEVSL